MNKRANTTLVTLLLLALGAGGQAFAQVPMEPGMTNVTFSGPGGVTLRGYLATPPGSGRSPAVLMIHEWWGLNRNIVLLADALAREGFVVLAADAFRGSVAQTAQEAATYRFIDSLIINCPTSQEARTILQTGSIVVMGEYQNFGKNII